MIRFQPINPFIFPLQTYSSFKDISFIFSSVYISNNQLNIQTNQCQRLEGSWPGNRTKGKGNGAGLAWESQSHCFADQYGNFYTHSSGTDTQQDFSQWNCRTMLSIIIKLELRVVYCKLQSNYILCMKIWLYSVDLNI